MRNFSFSSLLIGAAFFASATALAFPQQTNALAASSLTQLTGVTAGDYIGSDIASGDFNGDGYDDLLLGSYYGYTGSPATQTGVAYVIYGSATPMSAQSLNASNVVELKGEMEYAYAGFSVASAGDIDNDGYDDMLIGALQQSTTGDIMDGEGAAYLIYGSATPLTSASLSTAVKFTGTQALQYFGYHANGIGDIDNDGYDDFAVGSPSLDDSGANKGAAYIFYGSATRYTSGNVSTLGVRLLGETTGDFFGSTVNTAGDLDADGYDDLLIGSLAYGASNTGATYVIYGSGTRITAGSIAGNIRLTGEAASDAIGYFAGYAGDLNADGYADALIGTPYAETSSGVTYLIYGSATRLTSQSLAFAPKISGLTTAEGSGHVWDSNDTINADAYSDFLIGASSHTEGATSSVGMMYLFSGQAAQISTGGVNTLSTTSILGEAANDNFGEGAVLADLNGDGLAEVIIGAPNNDDGANNAGAIYIGYLRFDLDGDGVLSSAGLLEQGTDCNDSDATVSANQTYYVDDDGDGLGVAETTTSVCSSTAPDGYASNDDDTDDAIANNGVEIGGDGIDNDGDGKIDEANTLGGNEAHPTYGEVDPKDTDAVKASIASVTSTRKGKMQVTYADDSVYNYKIFNGKQKKLKLKKYKKTGYYLALSNNGRKLALVNALNGQVLKRTSFKTGIYRNHKMQLADLREDGTTELVITSKAGERVRLIAVGLNMINLKFVHIAQLTFNAAEAQIQKTVIANDSIALYRKTGPFIAVELDKDYQLNIIVRLK